MRDEELKKRAREDREKDESITCTYISFNANILFTSI